MSKEKISDVPVQNRCRKPSKDIYPDLTTLKGAKSRDKGSFSYLKRSSAPLKFQFIGSYDCDNGKRSLSYAQTFLLSLDSNNKNIAYVKPPTMELRDQFEKIETPISYVLEVTEELLGNEKFIPVAALYQKNCKFEDVRLKKLNEDLPTYLKPLDDRDFFPYSLIKGFRGENDIYSFGIVSPGLYIVVSMQHKQTYGVERTRRRYITSKCGNYPISFDFNKDNNITSELTVQVVHHTKEVVETLRKLKISASPLISIDGPCVFEDAITVSVEGFGYAFGGRYLICYRENSDCVWKVHPDNLIEITGRFTISFDTTHFGQWGIFQGPIRKLEPHILEMLLKCWARDTGPPKFSWYNKFIEPDLWHSRVVCSPSLEDDTWLFEEGFELVDRRSALHVPDKLKKKIVVSLSSGASMTDKRYGDEKLSFSAAYKSQTSFQMSRVDLNCKSTRLSVKTEKGKLIATLAKFHDQDKMNPPILRFLNMEAENFGMHTITYYEGSKYDKEIHQLFSSNLTQSLLDFVSEKVLNSDEPNEIEDIRASFLCGTPETIGEVLDFIYSAVSDISYLLFEYLGTTVGLHYGLFSKLLGLNPKDLEVINNDLCVDVHKKGVLILEKWQEIKNNGATILNLLRMTSRIENQQLKYIVSDEISRFFAEEVKSEW